MPDRTASPAIPGPPARADRPSLLPWILAGLVIAGLAAGYVLGLHRYLSLSALAENRERLLGLVANRPVGAALGYLAVYATAVSLSFPGASLLTIAGGALFGWLLGGCLALVAATAGACAIFLIARTSIGEALARKAGPRLQKLREGFERDAFNYLLVIRLAPVVPFWLANLAPALFGMRFAPYALATAIGILPATFAFAWFGHSLGDAIASGEGPVSPRILLALGALAVVAAIPLVVRRLRRPA